MDEIKAVDCTVSAFLMPNNKAICWKIHRDRNHTEYPQGIPHTIHREGGIRGAPGPEGRGAAGVIFIERDLPPTGKRYLLLKGNFRSPTPSNV
jgi:hypothetical protein